MDHQPIMNWNAVYQVYESAKLLFASPEDSETAQDIALLLQQGLAVSKALILIKSESNNLVHGVDTQQVIEYSPEDFLDCIPMLYSSISCTNFSQDEITALLEVLKEPAGDLQSGLYFAVECGDQFSIFFILLSNETPEQFRATRQPSLNNIEAFMADLAKSTRTLVFGNDLDQQLKERQKRQSIWLESLAWLNDFGARQFTEEDLNKFYSTASFQLKLLVEGSLDLAFQVTDDSSDLRVLNETEIAQSAFIQGLLATFISEKTFQDNKMIHVGREHNSMLEASDLSDVMLFPLFFGETLKMVLCVGKHTGLFDEQEKSVALLFAEGVGHILERWNFRKSIELRNQLLQEEKLQQQNLIRQLQSAQDQLLQQEKMASIGQLAAGVAHEINNPVGYVNSNINSLEGYLNDLFDLVEEYEALEEKIGVDTPVVQKIQKMKKEIDFDFVRDDVHDLVKESKEGILRVKQIVKDLKDFSHVDEAEWQWADLQAGIKSTLNIVHNEIKYKAEVILDLNEIPAVECVPSQINQVVMNMLVNASHAIEERGTITVHTEQVDDDWVTISVQDTGKGIAAENIPKLFDPFFTTKPVGQGTGLGLSLSYSIIEKHGGDIQVESTVGVGTTFIIKLPIKQKEAKAE